MNDALLLPFAWGAKQNSSSTQVAAAKYKCALIASPTTSSSSTLVTSSSFSFDRSLKGEDEGKKKPTTAATASKGRRQLFVLRGSKHFAEALIAFLSLGFRKFHKRGTLMHCSSRPPLMVATQIDHQKCRKNESNFWWWSWWRVVNYHANEIEEGLISYDFLHHVTSIFSI